MISKKYYNIVFSFLAAFLMSLIMSGFVSFINLGFSGGFLKIWFFAWIKVFPIALIISIFIIPLVKKVTDKITK